jgi:hypothetical protein
MEITPSWFGGLNFCHSTGVISFSYKPFSSTRIAGGFLFRTFRPQLAKALIKRAFLLFKETLNIL